MNSNCKDLYFLSTLACQLSECLTAEELALLSANLQALGELLDVVITRREICEREPKENV